MNGSFKLAKEIAGTVSRFAILAAFLCRASARADAFGGVGRSPAEGLRQRF
jgi:hypothetical protein